jgi:acyl carrier protein
VAGSLAVLLGQPPDALDGGHLLVGDLGLDSLALVELWDLVEEAAGVAIDLRDASTQVSVRDLVTAVESAWRVSG